MFNKLAIPPKNAKAVKFFEELAKRKAEFHAKLDEKFSFIPSKRDTTIKPKGK